MTELAARVIKARYSFGTCPTCGLAVIQGQRIGKVEQTGAWHHVLCLIRPEPGDEDGSSHD